MEKAKPVAAASERQIRCAKYFRALMETLESAGGVLRKEVVYEQLRQRLALSDYERERIKSGNERWWSEVQLQFIAFDKAKWLVRNDGEWRLLPAGREALAMLSAQQAFVEATTKYKEWKRSQPAQEGGGREEADEDEAEAPAPIWLIGAGPDGAWAEQFEREQRIFVGFPGDEDGKAFGPLDTMSKDQIRERMIAVTGLENPMNYVHCAWQFAHEMQEGHVVIIRKGNGRVLGHGVIAGPYQCIDAEGRRQHVRAVRWQELGEASLPPKYLMPTKTLTEISRYAGFADVMLGRRTAAALKELEKTGRYTAAEIDRYFAEHPFAASAADGGTSAVVGDVPLVSLDEIAEEAFIERAVLQDVHDAIDRKLAVVLQGPPGTGKTWLARKLASRWANDAKLVTTVQFHPAYQYEDFVRGLRPRPDGGFEVHDGVLVQLADRARANPGIKYVLLIDEINRANIAKVLGETLSLVEADKRSAQHAVHLALPRDGRREFWLPDNLAIVATMNTADRSIAMVDHALRRRFAFFTLSPAFARPQRFEQWLTSQLSAEEDSDLAAGGGHADAEAAKRVVERIVQSMAEINRRIAQSKLLGEGFVLGHSYFCNQPSRGGVDDPVDWMKRIFREEIAPMLREYAADQPKLLDQLIEPIRDLLAQGTA